MTTHTSFNRLLNIELPLRQSAFLWGARKTGKSTYLKARFQGAVVYDLLHSDLYVRLLKAPYVLREEILALSPEQLKMPVIIDEVQKIPALMDEVHWLIENTEAQFILCGSSARKLKRSGANLLGGRAWKYTFYPLTFAEVPELDLLRAFNHGLIPSHYLTQNPRRSLKAYLEDYLLEEIKAEGLTRNLPAFARFLDAAAFSNGALVNYANIARDSHVDVKTVKEYYQILIDTLIGYCLNPFSPRGGRETVSATPKFYFFDVGVALALQHRTIALLKGSEAGEAFEHFILMELMAYKGLFNPDVALHFWRTKTGLEVDFVLGQAEVAIEVKISENPALQDVKGLSAFAEEHPLCQCYVVALLPRARQVGRIRFVPWQTFLTDLWAHRIISPSPENMN
ncbi:MAG: AAA family ATPase [Gammaproteobacteria bacterium RIFCSPHIGHO2_12_FULL_45_9]|nr:MAG: AAA family ATPase [Gammaproteobacteria bacterium RIFCSPHIGHO2_12_FULL_45_9]